MSSHPPEGTTPKVTPLRPRRPCPECGRPNARDFYPFCCARCKDVDLNRWLSGAYAIPMREEEQDAPSESPGRNDD